MLGQRGGDDLWSWLSSYDSAGSLPWVKSEETVGVEVERRWMSGGRVTWQGDNLTAQLMSDDLMTGKGGGGVATKLGVAALTALLFMSHDLSDLPPQGGLGATP